MPQTKRYPKLIDPDTLSLSVSGQVENHLAATSLKSKSSFNKTFFYLIGFCASAILIAFIVFVNIIPQVSIDELSKVLASIPFLDLKLSKEVIKQLQFSNPVTNTILISNFLFVGFVVIDVFRRDKPRSGNFKESSSLSFTLHILVLFFMLLSLLVSWQPRPKVQVTKIEYIPTQIPSKKAPPVTTKRRADKQSVNQGKHDPTKPVKAPSKAPGTPQLPTKTQAQPKAPAAKSSEAAPAPQAKPKLEPTPKKIIPEPKLIPQPKLDREALEKAETKDTKTPLPKLMNYGSNQSTQTGTSKSDSPNPKGVGDNRGTQIASKLSSIPRAPDMPASGGQGGGYGTDGNPDKNAFADRPPSLAAQADINFGPYMSALQRKIKRSWKPPRGSESNRIVVTFSVVSDGSLSDLKLLQASGDPEANLAAMQAVSRAAPFDPLPPGSAPTVEIEFTFDYNVFQRSRF